MCYPPAREITVIFFLCFAFAVTNNVNVDQLLFNNDDSVGRFSISSLYLQYRVQIVLQLTTELLRHLKMREIYNNKRSDN